MPQMAPINWLTLMLFFISIFIMFNILNYYIFNYKIKSFSMKQSKISLNWKW